MASYFKYGDVQRHTAQRENGSLRAVLLSLAVVSLISVQPVYSQPFRTVINLPPDPNIGNEQSIGSNTQLNLSDGGEIGWRFRAGESNGGTNTEVNITGGSVGTRFAAPDGTEVNVSGGSFGRFFAEHGSVVNITGGWIRSGLEAFEGSLVNLSGGSVGRRFGAHEGSDVNIFGGDFRVNGTPVAGLDTAGDIVDVNLPFGAALSGTYADGTPFVLENFTSETIITALYDGTPPDGIADGTLTLHAVELPPIGPATIDVQREPAPASIRGDQTILVDDGGVVGDGFKAGWGSTVTVNGGTVAVDHRKYIRSVEAVGALIDIYDGKFGAGPSVFYGSELNIFGGLVSGPVFAYSGAEVNVSGGVIERWVSALDGSVVNITGGLFESKIEANPGSVLNISGGTFDALQAVGSTIRLFGTEFVLDGIDITSTLTPNVPFAISDRDVTLSGRLAAGAPFSFDLTSEAPDDYHHLFDDLLHPSALLIVTLVPEPTSALLLIPVVGAVCLLRGRVAL